jgi:YD repeat-containing protein
MPTLGSGVSNPGDAEAFTLYDANSNLKSKTKRDGTTIINFTYDVLNRRTAKTFPATASANVSYAYDAAGRRITEATNGRSLGFAYDSDSNPHTLTWPDAASVTYAYDTADRFGQVSNSAFSVAAGYDALSRVNALTRPSSSSTIGYDAADRVTSLAHAFTPTTGNETWTLGFTSGGQLASAASSNSAWDWAPTVASSVATVPD